MPKPNYRFDKKQRELKKSQKQEEKRQRKQANKESAVQAGETVTEVPHPEEHTA